MNATRKAGELVDAQQLFPGEPCESVCFSHYFGCIGECHVHTTSGPMCINAGDWIVHRNGEAWVVVDDEFGCFYNLETGRV